MKRLLVVLLLAVAIPAHAASRFVGTWYVGDNVRVLRLDVRDDHGVAWGAAVGPGYTPTLQIRKPNDTTIFATLSGAWEDGTDTAVLFAIGGATVLYPAATSPVSANVFADYEAVLVLTNANAVTILGADGQANPFTFRIKAFP